MPIGIDNIQLMSEEAIRNEREIISSGGYPPEFKDDEPPGGDEDKEKAEPKEKIKKWRVWDLEFEALMRMLDNAVSDFIFSYCIYDHIFCYIAEYFFKISADYFTI